MEFIVNALIGALLALGFVVLARRAGRLELAWIATGLIVAAVIYPLLGLDQHGLGGMPVEAWGTAVFAAFAILGASVSPWFLALGWALHGFWDLLLPWVADTAYVPPWYAAACLGFDAVVAGAMVLRALKGPAARTLATEAH